MKAVNFSQIQPCSSCLIAMGVEHMPLLRLPPEILHVIYDTPIAHTPMWRGFDILQPIRVMHSHESLNFGQITIKYVNYTPYK